MSSIDFSKIEHFSEHVRLFNRIRDENCIIEDDFKFLMNFKGLDTLVVDVGSNIGAFAMNALQLASTVDVIAFEPNISLKSFQDEVSKYYEGMGRAYKYKLVGLSDAAGKIMLYVPRIANWHVIGEASMDPSIFELDLIKSRLNGYSGGLGFTIDTAIVDVVVFDDLDIGSIDKYEQIFLKVDVENFEPFVLNGMKNFLSKFKPMAMIENSRQDTIEIMQSLGYKTYEYNLDQNSLVFRPHPSGSNIFYVHPGSPFGVPSSLKLIGN